MSKCAICDEPVKVRYFGKDAQGRDTYQLVEALNMADFEKHVREAHAEQVKHKEPEFSED